MEFNKKAIEICSLKISHRYTMTIKNFIKDKMNI